MIMATKWILYVFIFLTSYDRHVETSHCNLRDQIDSCQYTIVCESYTDDVIIPMCHNMAYVTLKIINSKTAVLDEDFFELTRFDSKVFFLTAINNSWTNIKFEAFRSFYKITHIDLSGNKIRHIENGLVRAYPLLYMGILDLSNNLLNNIASDVFDYCPNLRELYLHNNKITELNMILTTLKKLIVLDLSYNDIVRLSAFEMNPLTSLKRVNISNNLIKTVEANCFNQAFNLKSLDLSNNYIKSAIHNSMFINNGKLSYLSFYNNTISKIEGNAFQHTSLVDFNLDKNFISGEVTETTFAGLQKVKNLTLYRQNITFINANAFIEMTSLNTLNLSANNIDVIDQSGFNNTNSLIILDLSYNNIKDLTFLKGVLVNLTSIYLNNNKIELIPKYAFANQTCLKRLDISNNRIVTIEQYSLPLSNLQYLNVSGTLLAGSVKSNVFSPAPFLRFLDISNLNITKIEELALIDLPRLARLNLSYNAIEYIGQKNFLNLSNMFSLDLSNNRLTRISLNGTFIQSLTALYLNNNNLSNVSVAIPNSTAIMYLDISHNNITELTGTAFETLKELQVLRAANNRLKIFNNPQLNLLSKLKDLDLSSNQITAIDLGCYRDLVRADISNNSLNNLNSTALENADNLQVLNISNNNISILQPGMFQNAKILKILNVSSNNLKNVRYGSFRGLHKIELIDLSRNKLTEMDVDVFHECKELATLIIDYNHIKYIDIEQLTDVMPKLRSLSIGGNLLDCKQIIRSLKYSKTFVVEITSIHKVFHEDNVNGIKCGKAYLNTTVTTVSTVIPSDISKLTETSHSSALFIWCLVLTVIIFLFIVRFLFRKYHALIDVFSQLRMQSNPSVELSGLNYQSNLLN